MNSKLKKFYNTFIKNPLSVGILSTGVLFGANSNADEIKYRLDWNNYQTIKVTKEDFGKGIRDYYKTQLDSLNLPDSLIFGIADSVARRVFSEGKGFNVDLIREGSNITIPKIIFTGLDTTSTIDTTQIGNKLGQGILPDTTLLDSTGIRADTIAERLSPIEEFTTKYDSTKIKLLEQAKAVSNLNQIVNSFYKLAGDANTLKDDDIEGLLATIEEFNTNYASLDSSLYAEVSDSLSKILKLRKDFAKNYSKLLNSVKNKFGNSITNLDDLIEINSEVNQNLEGFTQTKLTKLKFAPYDSSFKNLTLEEDILINENNEIIQFITYLTKLDKDRKEILGTGMGNKIIKTQNLDLEELTNFYKGKRNKEREATDEMNIPYEELVKKQIKLIDRMLEKISDITGTEYQRISKKPKLKHEKKPITFINGVEVGALYSSGTKGQIAGKDLGEFMPMVGLNLVNFGDLSLTVGYGKRTAISKGEEETIVTSPTTGNIGHSLWGWESWGSDEAYSTDISKSITKGFKINLGCILRSKDHNPHGYVEQWVEIPGVGINYDNTFFRAQEGYVGNDIFGTIGAQLELKKGIYTKFKGAFEKGSQPSYQITIGYNRARR